MNVYDNMNEMSVRIHTPPSLGFWPSLAHPLGGPAGRNDG